MPIKSYQKDFFRDKQKIKNSKKSNSKRYINGVLVEPNTMTFKIQNAAAILKNNNNLPFQADPSDIKLTSLEVLFAIGVTPINNEFEFSFLKTENIPNVSNPNIMDVTRYTELKNKKIKATDKFIDPTNPFYNIDEGTSINKQMQIKQTKKVAEIPDNTKIASAFFDINIENTSTPTIKEFK